MTKKVKASVMDAAKIKRVVSRMATEILERNRDLKNLVIAGIPTRGIVIAKRIAKVIKDLEKTEIPVGVIDIARFRDDGAASPASPSTRKTSSWSMTSCSPAGRFGRPWKPSSISAVPRASSFSS